MRPLTMLKSVTVLASLCPVVFVVVFAAVVVGFFLGFLGFFFFGCVCFCLVLFCFVFALSLFVF